MKVIVVYKSQTGFTKKYADMVAEEIGCKAIPLNDLTETVLGEYDTVIFGSRIHGGRVDGLKKIKKFFNKNLVKNIILFATGGTPNGAEAEIAAVWKNSLSLEELDSIPHFYMQAGLCYEKMSIPDRLIMKTAASILSKKDNKSAYDTGFEQAIKNSYDISSKDYVKPLLDYVRESF